MSRAAAGDPREVFARPVNINWHHRGAEGLPHDVQAEYRLGGPLLIALSQPVVLMSDFKLGIVRLGRVAGKVSWIRAAMCGEGGPAGITKSTKKHVCYG